MHAATPYGKCHDTARNGGRHRKRGDIDTCLSKSLNEIVRQIIRLWRLNDTIIIMTLKILATTITIRINMRRIHQQRTRNIRSSHMGTNDRRGEMDRRQQNIRHQGIDSRRQRTVQGDTS